MSRFLQAKKVRNEDLQAYRTWKVVAISRKKKKKKFLRLSKLETRQTASPSLTVSCQSELNMEDGCIEVIVLSPKKRNENR